jgi:hypothetical protein
MNAATLDKLNEMDPIYYTEEEVLGLLDLDTDSVEAWHVRGATAWFLEITAPPDEATPEQVKWWRVGWQAAVVRFLPVDYSGPEPTKLVHPPVVPS